MKELIIQDGIQFVDLQRLFLPRDDFLRIYPIQRDGRRDGQGMLRHVKSDGVKRTEVRKGGRWGPAASRVFFRRSRKTRPAGETDKTVPAGRGVCDRYFYGGVACLLMAALVFVLYALIGAQMAMSFD